MIQGKYFIEEEIHQMRTHKWLMSQSAGHDVGESAFFDWVFTYEGSFREWANSLPENCINCGLDCQKDSTECIKPFVEHRIKYLEKHT